MAKLIGNYTVPGQTTENVKPGQAGATEREKAEGAHQAQVSEFERRAMGKLGGSIAFVMKGKNVLWTGDKTAGSNKGTGNEK
ncbi:MAG: hypothetical protein Q8L77_01060 [Nitrospirota bacterium]|nr:hypothetical protein [Nitrospirota bacterium]